MQVLLDNQATGATKSFEGDAVSVAKKNLIKGDILDGEGGTKVWGKLIPSRRSLSINALPIGLANKVKLSRNINEGEIITQSDVTNIRNSNAYLLRKEMENDFKEMEK